MLMLPYMKEIYIYKLILMLQYYLFPNRAAPLKV